MNQLVPSETIDYPPFPWPEEWPEDDYDTDPDWDEVFFEEEPEVTEDEEEDMI